MADLCPTCYKIVYVLVFESNWNISRTNKSNLQIGYFQYNFNKKWMGLLCKMYLYITQKLLVLI